MEKSKVCGSFRVTGTHSECFKVVFQSIHLHCIGGVAGICCVVGGLQSIPVYTGSLAGKKERNVSSLSESVTGTLWSTSLE